jgi:hypothetical protein
MSQSAEPHRRGGAVGVCRQPTLLHSAGGYRQVRQGQGWDMYRGRMAVPVVERSAFAGFRFPPEAITVGCGGTSATALWHRDVEELLAQRVQVQEARPRRLTCSFAGGDEKARSRVRDPPTPLLDLAVTVSWLHPLTRTGASRGAETSVLGRQLGPAPGGPPAHQQSTGSPGGRRRPPARCLRGRGCCRSAGRRIGRGQVGPPSCRPPGRRGTARTYDGPDRSPTRQRRLNPQVSAPSGTERERSVKPSAQPTMVRIHHPPPPARTRPDLGYDGLAYPWKPRPVVQCLPVLSRFGTNRTDV